MRTRGLLSTARGRLAAFFLLYLAEGLPLGFTATAVATQMRRQGLGVSEIGAFVAALYLPWGFKWAFGPIVDVVSSDRFGRRRTWIVAMQAMMVVTLLAASQVDFTADVGLFTALVLVLNVFSATQDVATDALAVNTLHEGERGLANGVMFAGQNLGIGVGGAGALFLSTWVGFRATFAFVAGCVAAVAVLVSLRLREPADPRWPPEPGSALAAAGTRIAAFVREVLAAFFGSRAAFAGLLFGALPAGAFALSLALQSNLAVELGLGDRAIATLSFLTTAIAALGCVAGGWSSDRLGRRRVLAITIALTAVPTLVLAEAMWRSGWILPAGVNARPIPAAGLVVTFWAAALVHAAFHGMMFGTRTALFMDITTARVAATQFTAYMALLNLVTSYSARWQGAALARWGYPVTLALDAALGLVGLAVLPFVTSRAGGGGPAPEPARAPARLK